MPDYGIEIIASTAIGGVVILKVIYNQVVKRVINSGKMNGVEGSNGTGYLWIPQDNEVPQDNEDYE